MDSIILLDNDIYINEHPVLRVNCNIDIRNMDNNKIYNNIDKVMDFVKNEYDKGLCKRNFIMLVDFNNLNKDQIDISKIKIILNYILNKYTIYLEKCVIYNYNIFWKFLINTIMSIIDINTKKKICFKKNLQI
jgi:hypothetical protein